MTGPKISPVQFSQTSFVSRLRKGEPYAPLLRGHWQRAKPSKRGSGPPRRMRMRSMRVCPIASHAMSLLLTAVRWWAGVTYVAGGVGGVIAAPLVISSGDAGGWFLLIGGPELALLGWLVHPWGFQRWHRGRYQRRALVSV